ncbi:carbohydrate-binding domain-containing protein [Arthrobacter agilis]|uniref:carbohydrate-binding domain-containing protein n=1 Tax=Arthrobacter agilis TaxID=37921 RepID=UPI0023667423|nr:carbohydrate-binding domain-containing protein [Arthrobacter agilis]WDF33297.1 carbohydrate-binding domain-containing protein [Arthrobacter agilis]
MRLLSTIRTTTLRTSVAGLALTLALAGCSVGTTVGAGSTTSTTQSADTATTESAASDTTATTAVVADSTAIAEDTHYDDDDLTWDAADEVAVTLADGSTSAAGDGVTVDGDVVTITAAGTYRLSGSLTDGQVVVAAGEEDVVRLILDGVELTSSTGSPLVVTSADEALVYLEDGSTNTLTDADSYADDSSEAPNAALYSMADLTIAGDGSLTVNGTSNDGIVSKDGLVLAAGDVTVDAVDDGITGKDYIALLGGTYDVTAGGDGIKSTNEDEDGRGWFTVYGGDLVVSSGDDGVKAATTLTVDAGTVTVTESVEGMEAPHIIINGGTSEVTSSDDGVNAAGGSAETTSGMGGGMDAVGDYTVSVTGGSLTITSDGDGLDSNGDAGITGGTVVVNGPTGEGNGALDVNGELTVDGGTVAAAGSAGMAVTPGAASAQSGVQLTFASTVPAGTAIQIADADGTVVGSFVGTKDTASLIFSSASITAGETYTVYTGGTTTASEGVTEGTLDGADELGTVTAGEYTQSQGPGRR